jgi:endothelin-converting enzyme
MYTDVVERLLLSLPEEDNRLQKSGGDITVQEANKNVWPPWPWPPWGGDDDDDDGGDDRPGNWTERARKLARDAVKFERKLAEASLDL